MHLTEHWAEAGCHLPTSWGRYSCARCCLPESPETCSELSTGILWSRVNLTAVRAALSWLEDEVGRRSVEGFDSAGTPAAQTTDPKLSGWLADRGCQQRRRECQVHLKSMLSYPVLCHLTVSTIWCCPISIAPD